MPVSPHIPRKVLSEVHMKTPNPSMLQMFLKLDVLFQTLSVASFCHRIGRCAICNLLTLFPAKVDAC